ncbi:hypothetical protein BGZ99_001878 [Dissophora globulifera]|uniref:PAS domain-containing protein n=1 Tax=Dissophora globulifera TaxID=979702 RepID=A0A9P6RNJ1_9FUNG|nr:hypothetical protein BGZ99_001878 [Dissophora globulifera]
MTEFKRIKRHHKAFLKDTWNPSSLDPEPRACVLLNRFTRGLGIMYASPSCEMIFQFDPETVIGKPFLLFVRADDLGTFMEQVDIAKSTTAITHMRFHFQSPQCRQEIPCEIMLFGAADGMIAILRRSKPFTRRQLITAPAPSSDYFASVSSGNSSLNTHHSGSYNNSHSSYGSNFSPHQIQQELQYHQQPHQQQQHQHQHQQHQGDPRYQINANSSGSSPFATSPLESLATSFTSSISESNTNAPNPFGAWSYRAPLRDVTIGSISNIRNLDRAQRPLRSLHEDESDIEDTETQVSATYGLRRHHIQASEVNDLELESGMERLVLEEDDDDDDDYNDDYNDDDDDDMDQDECSRGPDDEELVKLDVLSPPSEQRVEQICGAGAYWRGEI